MNTKAARDRKAARLEALEAALPHTAASPQNNHPDAFTRRTISPILADGLRGAHARARPLPRTGKPDPGAEHRNTLCRQLRCERALESSRKPPIQPKCQKRAVRHRAIGNLKWTLVCHRDAYDSANELSSAAPSKGAVGYLLQYFNHGKEETSRLGVGCSVWLGLLTCKLQRCLI